MYRVVRFYREAPFGKRRRVIISRCSLKEAQAHCQDPETSSSTCTKAAGKRRTQRMGPWFDGYEEVR